eukprot:10663655-Karenia_brevis.AAC.1
MSSSSALPVSRLGMPPGRLPWMHRQKRMVGPQRLSKHAQTPDPMMARGTGTSKSRGHARKQ